VARRASWGCERLYRVLALSFVTGPVVAHSLMRAPVLDEDCHRLRVARAEGGPAPASLPAKKERGRLTRKRLLKVKPGLR
jgi:hypothetical protein